MRELHVSDSSSALPGSRLPRRGAARKRVQPTATKQLALSLLLSLAVQVSLRANGSVISSNRHPVEPAIAEWDANGATPKSAPEVGSPIPTPWPQRPPKAADENRDNRSSDSPIVSPSRAGEKHETQSGLTSQESPGGLNGGAGRD
ncbi:hypothetical protein CSUI_008278, partial [Cystoisospora suis]